MTPFNIGVPCGTSRFKKWVSRPVSDSSSFCSVLLRNQLSCRHNRRRRIGVQSACISVMKDRTSTTLLDSRATSCRKTIPLFIPQNLCWAYNSLKHRFSVDATGEERHSADWHSLNLFDLNSGVVVDSINQETLTLPAGIVRGWVSTIVAFSEARLFVQAGLSKESSRMDYFIAEVGLSTHVLTPILALPATFM